MIPSGNPSWTEAARRARAAQKAPTPVESSLTERQKAAKLLELFMQEQGDAAMTLLRATNKAVVFGGGISSQTVWLDGNGLCSSGGLVTGGNVTPPEAVMAYMSSHESEQFSAEAFIEWLRKQIDDIAKQVS
ncbi:MAG: hypothetical protein PVI21_00150 [Candidatus Woesebacteria bacterium]